MVYLDPLGIGMQSEETFAVARYVMSLLLPAICMQTALYVTLR